MCLSLSFPTRRSSSLLESVQAELRGAVAELLVQGANDEAAGLLHFQRMGEAAAHRGIALQRKHLRLLLQAAHRGRVNDAPAIALQLVQHGVEAARSEAHTSELQSLMRTSYAVF